MCSSTMIVKTISLGRSKLLIGKHSERPTRTVRIITATKERRHAHVMSKRTRGAGQAQLDNYEVGKVLGQGSFAIVKSVTRKSDGERE